MIVVALDPNPNPTRTLTLLQEGSLGSAVFSGYVDNAWFYTRPLQPCEVEALYFTDAFAVSGAAAVDLPEGAHPLKTSATISMWVMPHTTDQGWATLAATQLDGTGVTLTLSLSLTLALTLTLTLTLTLPCAAFQLPRPWPGELGLEGVREL